MGETPFRFVGYNIRGICHYGQGDVLPYSSEQDRYTQLSAARDHGIRVIRVFAANKFASPVAVGNRLESVLNYSQAYGLYVIVCLTDFYIDSNMWVKGDEHYYGTYDGGGYQVLQQAWYAGGFEDNYWPMVEYLVTRFKSHPAIFAWEIGNELKHLPNPTLFVQFMKEIRTRIRALDPNHMITTGMISTRHTGISQYSEQARDLYRDFDFVTSHCYNGSDLEDQSALATALNKPLVIEEVGFDKQMSQFDTAEKRITALQNDMNKWFGRGAAGYMQWGFQAQQYNIGDGDIYVGMDRYQNGDAWQGFVQAYTQRATNLLQNPPTQVCRHEIASYLLGR